MNPKERKPYFFRIFTKDKIIKMRCEKKGKLFNWSKDINLNSEISVPFYLTLGELEAHFKVYTRLEGCIIYVVFSFHEKSDFLIDNDTEDIDIEFSQVGSDMDKEKFKLHPGR